MDYNNSFNDMQQSFKKVNVLWVTKRQFSGSTILLSVYGIKDKSNVLVCKEV